MKIILILGYKLLSSGKMSNILKRRLDVAIKYYKSGDIFLVSGGKNGKVYHTEAYEMKKYLLENIPNVKILSEVQSKTTYENIQYSKNILNNYKKKVVLVSSRNHLKKIKKILNSFNPNIGWTLVYK